MASNLVVLILGAGPRVGASVAEKFASNGYKVATASRSGDGNKNDKGYLSLKADFTRPESIPALFEAIKTEFKAPPSVVVYNAAALTPPADKASPLSVPVEKVASDLNINTVSPYTAAQQAVKAWETFPSDVKKTFIYTGNNLNTVTPTIPLFVDLAMGKSASASWIGLSDTVYSAKGLRFFYADERFADGKSKGLELDGAAHAEFFAELATNRDNIPWHATFVKGKGYVHFK